VNPNWVNSNWKNLTSILNWTNLNRTNFISNPQTTANDHHPTPPRQTPPLFALKAQQNSAQGCSHEVRATLGSSAFNHHFRAQRGERSEYLPQSGESQLGEFQLEKSHFNPQLDESQSNESHFQSANDRGRNANGHQQNQRARAPPSFALKAQQHSAQGCSHEVRATLGPEAPSPITLARSAASAASIAHGIV